MQVVKDSIFKLIHLLPGGRVYTQKYLLSKNFLSRSGWKRSVKMGMPVDEKNRPIPWFTYGAIHFLADRIQPGMHIFEFGSGNSTLWLSERAERVVSLEHDAIWYQRMEPALADIPQIEFMLRTLDNGAYASEITAYENAFDLVVVDGRDRSRCARNAVGALRQGGVIVWDDSQRTKYKEGQDYLLGIGFKKLDFYGAGPISSHASCTSLFYRANNCLGI